MNLGLLIGLAIVIFSVYKIGHIKGYKKCEKEFNEVLSAREKSRRRMSR